MEGSAKNIVHPYSPVDLHLPHYVPNDKTLTELLGGFFGAVAVILALTWTYSGRKRNTQSSVTRRLTVCWFVMCGFIHTIIEGYFAAFHDTLAGDQSILGQLWKEYSMGDSRYLSSDSFTVCMETITAVFDGSMAFLTAWAILEKKPVRYIFQLVVSLCQLYGDTLYYTTEIKDGFKDTKMWHPIYFWFYFVFLNSLWIIIPFTLSCQAVYNLSLAQTSHDAASKDAQRGESKRKTKKIN